MQHETASSRLFHLLARYTYLQELVERQRVLVLGEAEAASADALDRLGVRRAVFIDSSEKRVQEARRASTSRRVEFMVGPFSRVALVEDSFDLAIVEDFGRLEDRARDLAAAKRGLTSSGVLAACIPNPDASVGLTAIKSSGLGYYEFYGQLADSFPFVRMIGQCPLVGFALADLAVDDPNASITFDSSLLEDGSEDAEFFVALCSRSPITADPFAVVQVPLSWVDTHRLMGAKGPRNDHKQPPKDAPQRTESKREGDARDSGQLAAELKRREEAASQEITKLKLEIDKRAVTIAKLENHLHEAREKAATEHDRVIQTKLALESEKKKLLNLQKEVEMGQRIQKMSPETDEGGTGRRTRSRQDVAEDRGRPDDVEREVKRLRAELESATKAAKQVEALAKDLEEERASRRKAESRGAELENRASRADGLAADLAKERGARKLAESHASELEKKLRALTQTAPASRRLSPAQEALKKAEAAFGAGASNEQVESLRAELAREHEARAAAEARLDELGHEDAAGRLQKELDEERKARRTAEESKASLEARLSTSEAQAAKLRLEFEARQRAEAAFGGVEPTKAQQVLALLAFELTT